MYSIVQDAKTIGTPKIKYSLSGVGGDPSCQLQIPVNHTYFESHVDAEGYSVSDMPFNTVKIEVPRLRTVTQALNIYKKVKKMRWNVVLTQYCNDHTYPDCNDSFISDFCVGLGTGQLFVGGVLTHNAKLNRIYEIVETEKTKIKFAGKSFRV